MPKTIKMLRDFKVSRDGFTVEKWGKDEIKEDVDDALAGELLHPQTLAAVEVTGNKKSDDAAELAALEEAEARAAEAAATKAVQGAPKPPKA